MNALTGANSGASSGGPTKTIFNIAVMVIVVLALYYFYKWLSGTGDPDSVETILYSSLTSGLPGKSTEPTVFTSTTTDLPALYEGGEYSVSTWVYITNWGVNKGYNKPFLRLTGGSTGGYDTLVMYLGQNVSKLGIRVSTDNMQLNTAELNKIRPSTGSSYGLSPYTDIDITKCDIEMIDLQRWVNINTVLNGRTLDVYIDGKLSRSCVLDGMFKVSGDAPKLIIGGPTGFGGLIGQTQAANYAYSPDQVYKIYQNGPIDTSITTKLMSFFDPGQWSLSVKRNGSNVIAA
jgi:hypothetical protein